jgi:hypothetical protein
MPLSSQYKQYVVLDGICIEPIPITGTRLIVLDPQDPIDELAETVFKPT